MFWFLAFVGAGGVVQARRWIPRCQSLLFPRRRPTPPPCYPHQVFVIVPLTLYEVYFYCGIPGLSMRSRVALAVERIGDQEPRDRAADGRSSKILMLAWIRAP